MSSESLTETVSPDRARLSTSGTKSTLMAIAPILCPVVKAVANAGL